MVERVGSQVPSPLSVMPKWGKTHGPEAAQLATLAGVPPLEWQGLVLDHTLGVVTTGPRAGKPSAQLIGLAVPRQNGKNAVVEFLELYWIVIEGARVLHTAHLLPAAKTAFHRIASFFGEDGPPELRSMVKKVTYTNGQEAIELVNGGLVKFSARNHKAGRGFSADKLVLDEAQSMSPEDLAALQPVISTSTAPQIFITGTPPTTRSDSQVWTNVRDGALNGDADTTLWLEWSATPTSDGYIDITDKDAWYEANPSLGLLISEDAVTAELAAMPEPSFLVERLGRFELAANVELISKTDWDACKRVTAQIRSEEEAAKITEMILAVDIGPGLSSASIAAAWHDPDTGLPTVEIIEHRAGTPKWVAPRLEELVKTRPIKHIILDGFGERGGLVEDMQSRKIALSQVNVVFIKDASEIFCEAVWTHALRHAGHPSLTTAVQGVYRKPVGDRWKIARKPSSDVDITPVIAASLAVRGLTADDLDPITYYRKPKRRKQGAANYTKDVFI